MKGLLLCFLMFPTLLSAKLSYVLEGQKLQLFTSNKSEAAIEFVLAPETFQAGFANPKIKEKLGSLKLKESLKDLFQFDHLVSICFDEAEQLRIQCSLRGKNGVCGLSILAHERADGALSLHFQLQSNPRAVGAANRLLIHYAQNPNAHIFGLGEQFSHLNFQGKKVHLLPEENGIGRGDPTITKFTKLAGAAGNEFSTYCPIPFYISSDGKAVSVAEGQPWYLDFQAEGQIEMYLLGKDAELLIWQKQRPLDLISAFSLENGRFRALPEWAFGTWLGIQGGPEKIEPILQKLKESGNPVTAIWIQDWVGKRQTKFGSRLQWHWQANPSAYPDLKAFIAKLRQQNIRTLGYINPFLATESAWADSLKAFLVKSADGRPIVMPAGGFDALQFELNDPACREMLANLIQKNMIDLGFSGWMADFAEWYPNAAEYPEGDFFSRHNAYPIQWQQTSRMALETTGNPSDYVFFSRSGYRNAGKYASVYWAGDQMTSWEKHDGLPSALNALISSGMSGIAINHSDIGGYTNVHSPILKINRDRELLFRWMEMAAFTPIFRTHEGLSPAFNVQAWSDSTMIAFFARMGKIHFALKDYLIQTNEEAKQNGWPMIRHPWLHFPQDPQTLDLNQQYFLGSDILVAPVVSAGESEVKVYFPAGDWQHLLREETIESKGEWYSIQAELGMPVVFVPNSENGQKIKIAVSNALN